MIKIEIGVKQLQEAITQLNKSDREKLLKLLRQNSLKDQWTSTFKQIDARVKKNPISQKEINGLVDEVRQEMYATNRR